MITVLGGSGFIGSHLLRRLEALGVEHRAPERGEDLGGRPLGHVVYCAGVTGDYRERPLDTVDAHVGSLMTLLREADLDALVYLSSTRVHRSEPDLYDLSKRLGEALALASDGRAVVLRLANVYGVDPGSPNFLASILRDALTHGAVRLRTALDSTRHYVSVDDVVSVIHQVVDRGTEGVYDVAGPRPVSHREVVGELSALTGCTVDVAGSAPTETAPELGPAPPVDHDPELILDALPRLVEGYRSALTAAR